MYMNTAIAAAILAFASRALAYDPSAYGSSSLHARDFGNDFDSDYGLYAREANPYASPDAAAEDDDFDLFARAAGEPEPKDEKLDLHARAAEAEYDDGLDFDLHARELDDALDGLHPRDAYLSGYEEGLYARAAEPKDATASSASSSLSASSSGSGGTPNVGAKWQLKSLQTKHSKELFDLSHKLRQVQQKYLARQDNIMSALKYRHDQARKADSDDSTTKSGKKDKTSTKSSSSGTGSGAFGKSQSKLRR